MCYSCCLVFSYSERVHLDFIACCKFEHMLEFGVSGCEGCKKMGFLVLEFHYWYYGDVNLLFGNPNSKHTIWTLFTVKIMMLTGLSAETLINRYVTIGAYSLLRSCTIEPECIIGQHSILMEGSLVETHSILEAGSVVPPGRRIPSGELWSGNPAKFVRNLTHDEILEIPKLAVAINDLSQSYMSESLPYSTVYLELEKLKKSLGTSL